MQGAVLLINMPPKVWRLKMINKCIPMNFPNVIEDKIFDCCQYGQAVFRPANTWKDRVQDDIIAYKEVNNGAELEKFIMIGKDVNVHHRSIILGIVKKYWDCFCKQGAHCPILDNEFSINTGKSKPVCCRKPHYGPYEHKLY